MTNVVALEVVEPALIFRKTETSSPSGTLSISRDHTPDGKVFILTDPEGVSMSPDEAWGVATALLNHLGATISLIDGARVLTAVKPS